MIATAPTTKFVVSSKPLRKALSFVGGAILANPIVPILENVLCEIRDGVMSLTGSDLNTTLSTRLEIEDSDMSLRCCLPYKTLSNLLATFPEQPVSFELNPETYGLTVTSNSGVYTLVSDDPSVYPVPTVDDDSEYKFLLSPVERSEFIDQLSRLTFAVSLNDLQAHLRGVCWWGSELCTTDSGMKLSRLTGAKDVGELQYLIPVNVIQQLVRSSPTLDTDQGLHINLNAHNILFSFGEYTILGTLINPGVNFPDYKQIFPPVWATTWILERNAFIAALRRVMVLSNMPTDAVVIEAEGTGKLCISVNDIDLGQKGNEILPAIVSDNLRIGFVGKVLLECCQNVAGDNLTIHLNAFYKGVMLTGDDTQASVLIFPVKV